MINENKIQNELYRDLTMCIRLYTLKNKCLIQMMKENEERVYEEIEEVISQAKIYIIKFQEIQTNSDLLVRYVTVMQRFFTRVKEITVSFLAKNSLDELISSYFNCVLNKLADWTKSTKFYQILSYIFFTQPQKSLPSKIQSSSQHSDQYHLQMKATDTIQLKKADSSFQSLERDYKLFEGIELDQGEYRKKYFMAREELSRKNNILLDDMIHRNKLVKDTIYQYRMCFENYRCKSAKELRDNRNKKYKFTQNYKPIQTQEEKRQKTNFSVSEAKGKMRPIISNRQNQMQSAKKFKSIETKTQKGIGTSHSHQFKVSEKTHKSKMMSNLFQPTKINFLDRNMEIGMSSLKEQKNNLRKKILFKKTEDNFHKKYEFFTKKNLKSQTEFNGNFQSLQLVVSKGHRK